MASTVQGTVTINTTQAVMALNRLKMAGRDADRQLQQLGRTIDRIGSASQITQIRNLTREIRQLGGAANNSSNDIDRLRREVDRLSGSIGALNAGGGVPGGLGGAGRRGLGLGGMVGGLGLMAAKIGILLPTIRSLTGAIGSLGITAGSALGGAGAVGAAGVAGLAVGIGGIAAVAIPAKKAVEEAAEAQKKYNEAVRDYGRASREAGAARDVMRVAFSGAPRGTRSLLAEAAAFKKAWAEATKSGQEALVGFAREIVRVADRIKGPLADISNRVSAAFAMQGGRAVRFLGSERMLRGLRAGAGIFTENLGNMRRIGQAAVTMFTQVVRASKPFVKEFTNFMAKWFGARARQFDNVKRVREQIRKMVDDLKAFGRLGGAGGRLVMALLGAGGARPAGRGLLDSATKQLEKWTKWIERNPAKIRSFFRETADGARKLASSLTSIVSLLTQASAVLMPLLGALSAVTGSAGSAGLIPALLGGAAVLGGAKGLKGAGGLRTLIMGGGPGPTPPGGGPPGPGTGGRVAALRGLAGGAARRLWPVAAILGGLGFAGTEGGVGRRLQGAAAPFFPGISGPKKYSELEAIGQTRAEKFSNRVGAPTSRRGLAAVQSEADRLEAELGARFKPGDRGSTTSTMDRTGRIRRTPSKVGQLKLTDDQRKVRQAQLDSLKNEISARQILVDQLKVESSIRNADQRGGQIQEAYRVRRRGGQSTAKAGEGLISDTLAQMRHRTTFEGKKKVAEGTLKWLAEAKKHNPKLGKVYEELSTKITRAFGKTEKGISIVEGRIHRSSGTAWEKIRRDITSPVHKAQKEAGVAFDKIYASAIKGLQSMGYSKSQATAIIKTTVKGGTGTQAPRTPSGMGTPSTGVGTQDPTKPHPQAIGNARGGRIRGRGLMDTVPLVDGSMAAPGELIVNRHTEDDHDADAERYGLPSLAERVKRQRRVHSAPRRRRHPRSDAYATGGRINLMGANQGLAPYAALGQSYGLNVSSGFRANSITNAGNVSNHASGNALDIAGPAPAMLSFAQAMASQYGSGLDELIHTPMGFGIKNGQQVPPYAAADHFDHVHVADKTPGGIASPLLGGFGSASLGGFGSFQLTASTKGLTGPGGAMAAQAIQAYTEGINQRLAAAGGGGTGMTGNAGVGGNVDQWLTEALNLTGQYSPQNLSALRSRAMQESGGDPRAQNNWDSNAKKGIPSKGLLQTIDPTFQAHALPGMGDIWNPVHNAVAAIRYMLSRYGHIVAANGQGYAEGGRVGEGFIRSVMGGAPSLFTRQQKPQKIEVSVNIGNVNMGAGGDAASMGEAIGNQVASRLAAALRAAPVGVG